MAKTNVRNLGKTLDGIRRATSHFDEPFYRELGEIALKRIRQTARTGKTMVSGQATKLKPLKKSTIQARERLQESGGADPQFFSPKRSNVTATGQFLESLGIVEIDKATRTLTIAGTGTRRGTGEPSNEQLGKYLSEGGRNIFGLDVTGRKMLVNRTLREIRRQLGSRVLRR